MKYNWFTLLACIYSLSLHAQQLLHCGADETQHELTLQYPELVHNWTLKYEELEDFTQAFVLQNNRGGDTIYKIPVVVHVIHYDGTENITDAQIHNGIEILTRNFRKLNPDTTDIVPYFKPLAADVKVEFELAKIDPDGNCTNGINRIRSTLTSTGGHNIKNLIHWPRNKYLNIYIVRNAAGLAGHALMPFQADTIPEWDGIVIAGDYVGNTGTSNDLRSVVLSHETGHYLNLFHIWGGNNVPGFYYLPVADTGNCAYDDNVFDTPNTIGWQSCNLSGNSCDTTPDNIQNFMDYAYCAHMFTHGQKARMHAALNSSIAERNNLWTTSNLLATGLNGPVNLCKADFTIEKNTWCRGDSVHFTDASYHNPTAWWWDFGDGNTSTQQNPVHAYNTEGLYTITLKVTNGTDTTTTIKTSNVYVLADSASFYLPYFEGFEYIDSVPQTGMVRFTENLENWQVTTAAAASGDQCSFIHNENDTLRYKYTLISPVLNLAGTDQPRIEFKYAFARHDSLNNDQMMVKISRNCGTNWALLNSQVTFLPTHSGYVNNGFVPATADWKQMSITNIPPSYKTNQVIFKIEFISGGGNDFYLDDINVFDLTTIGIENQEAPFFTLYPNPADGVFTLNGEFETGYVTLTNMAGQTMLQTTVKPGDQINTLALAAGVYIVALSNEYSTTYRKLIICH